MHFRGKITKIIFPRGSQENPDGFVIANMRNYDTSPTAQRNIIITGKLFNVVEDSEVDIEGDWTTTKYGQQIKVTNCTVILPKSETGIRKFLADNIEGIGQVLADRIVDYFGTDTLEVFRETPERLSEVPGITEKRRMQILESWEENQAVNEIVAFLRGFNVSNDLAFRIYTQYGPASITVVRDDPYRLAEEMDGIGFVKADMIAMAGGVERDSPRRIDAALTWSVKTLTEEEGNCFVWQKDLLTSTAKLLDLPSEMIEQRIRVLEERKSLIIQEINGQTAVYIPVYFHSERLVANLLMMKTLDSSLTYDDEVEFSIPRIEQSMNIKLDPIQAQAIEAAVKNNIVVITGGPGTGKTTIIRGIVDEFKHRGKEVRLAAPTARAAKRMYEVTKEDAKTIHRLLEVDKECRFQRNEENPLDGDVLIVDEFSMVGLKIILSVLKAVPDNMTLVLVGDADQLPSVESGNVLHDIIASECIPVVKLKTVFRQVENSGILFNAYRVNSGQSPMMRGFSDFFFVESSNEEMSNKVIKLVTKTLPEAFNVNPSKIQVLSPMKPRNTGVMAINRALQDFLNPEADDKRQIAFGDDIYREGDRVMQLRNDYEKDIFNGDMGIIRHIDNADKKLTIDFYGRNVLIEKRELINMTLAYAQTIHKSQGSEYEAVVIPIGTDVYHKMLSRNLLYTAITRAKRYCILVGSQKSFAIAAHNLATDRNTQLTERLKEYAERIEQRNSQED